MEPEADLTAPEPNTPADGVSDDAEQAPEAVKAQVQKIISKIMADKRHHEKAFKRMRRNMQIAAHGRPADESKGRYTANITGRHIRTKTNALYAKNPKAVARRRDTLDYSVWDETQSSLMIAMQTMQMAMQAQQAAANAPPVLDGLTGQPVNDPSGAAPPAAMAGFRQAQALIADYQAGSERRQTMKRFGRTLEVLFARALHEQQPLDFKSAMKKVVRRTCTTSVGYVEVGFQREHGPPDGSDEKIADARDRIAHLQTLISDLQEGEIDEYSPEVAELSAMIETLSAETVILREGLTFDFPLSTKVIPDSNCKSLVGFVGADVLTLEYTNYTKSRVKEVFGVDLGDNFTPYTFSGKRGDGVSSDNNDDEQGDLFPSTKQEKDSFVCVWKQYDQRSGLVYWVADGHDGYLRDPGPPEVTVNDFWPVYALTFNDVENENELFPPSDVELIEDMQKEINLSRQGKREHRNAARPRWIHPKGAIDEKDNMAIANMEPFENLGMDMTPGSKISDILQAVPVPGVDPNLYDTNEVFSDMQVTVGRNQALLGGISKASATESAISATSASESDGADIDDLDAFLSRLARAGSQILMREMDPARVNEICGPGAFWPEQGAQEIADEIYLEVEAGSTGKPNQAVEINNWNKMLPFLIQMGSIQPDWLAKETLRRLDDKMDLAEAVTSGVPSIVAQNALAGKGGGAPQPGTGDAASNPADQGAQGANNAPAAPGGPAGTEGKNPMGDNKSTPNVVRYGTSGKRL